MNASYILTQWRKGKDTHAIMTGYNALYRPTMKEHEVHRIIYTERETRKKVPNEHEKKWHHNQCDNH